MTHYQFSQIFLGFAAKDRYTVAESLLYHLENYGVPVWYDRHDLIIGDNRQKENFEKGIIEYNVPLVKTQMKKIIVTAKTLYSHPKNVSKIYAALHTDLAW